MKKKLFLNFPSSLVDKSIISDLVKELDLGFNILKAYVTPEEEGNLVIEFTGTAKNLEKGIHCLQKFGVKVELLGEEIEMIRERCTDCTVCVSLCPVDALFVDKENFSVMFDSQKCIACGLCVKACPTQAMVLRI